MGCSSTKTLACSLSSSTCYHGDGSSHKASKLWKTDQAASWFFVFPREPGKVPAADSLSVVLITLSLSLLASASLSGHVFSLWLALLKPIPASRGSSVVHPARSTSHSLLLFPGTKFLLLQFFIYVTAQSCSYLFSCCSSLYTWSKKGGLIWVWVCNSIIPLQFLIWGLLYRRDSLNTGFKKDSKSSMCQHPKSYVRIKGDNLKCWRKENGQREGEDIVEEYSLDRKLHVLRQGGQHQHSVVGKQQWIQQDWRAAIFAHVSEDTKGSVWCAKRNRGERFSCEEVLGLRSASHPLLS